jgi:hypothetical protein
VARRREDEEEAPRRRPKPGTTGTLRNHLAGRVDPLTSAVLVFPLFIIYQAGILVSDGFNGVDFTTRALVELAQRDMGNYLIVLAGMLLVYGAILVILRKRGTFSPRAFGPVLLESTFYALTMGSVILFFMQKLLPGTPGLAIGSGVGPVDVIVISAGAGLHEELIFRLIGMGGLSWLFAGLTGPKRAWLLALVVSSILFSVAHHVGPAGEDFAFSVFVFRTFAGVFFALIYHIRGFAVAAWTHALYDVYVLSFA